MGGPGAGVTQTVIYGGFLCMGLFLLCIAAAVILSLIPTFTSDHSQEGYGSEYQCDSVMLKFTYENFTSQFSNGTVGNSTALSDAATLEYEVLGVKNVAGCILYNGRAWDAANNSNTTRRRRRQSQLVTAGMYYIGSLRVFRKTNCGKAQSQNKTGNSTTVSKCVKKGIAEANSLFGGYPGTVPFLAWASTNRILIEVQDKTQAFQLIGVDRVYGVPPVISPAIADNLSGATNGTKGELQRGCRYVRSLSHSAITAILASETSSSNIDGTTISG